MKTVVVILMFGGLAILLASPIIALGEDSTAGSGNAQAATDTGRPVYLLITNESLRDAFQPLVDRRASQGKTAKLITVEEIYANPAYAGIDRQEEIRNCIRDHYQNYGTMYVALGGDDKVVPVRYCAVNTVKYKKGVPTDLYYSDMDGGDWDADDNGLYGEGKDVTEVELTPEIHLGRIAVRTANEATAYIRKVIKYETASPEVFANSMILIGRDPLTRQLHSGDRRPSDFLDHDPVSRGEIGMTHLYWDIVQPYWQATPLHGFFDTKSAWDVNRCGDHHQSGSNVVEALNRGYHHVAFSAHGGPHKWVLEGPRFNCEHAWQLTNPIPSIVRSGGCGVSWFDTHDDTNDPEPCLAEVFLRNPNGGAVVFFGYARAVRGRGGNYLAQLYREIFQNKVKCVGEAFTKSRVALVSDSLQLLQYHYVWSLLGDPALEIMEDEKARDLQVMLPNGCEVIKLGSDLTIRWNASGTNFAKGEKVKLEYSADKGTTWRPIPGAEALRHDGRLFTWQNCPLPEGSNYRVRVSSLSESTVTDTSDRNFTIGRLGLLTVRSVPVKGARLSGTHANITDYNISVLKGATVTLAAPDMAGQGHGFLRWINKAGKPLAEQMKYTFTPEEDTEIFAEYSPPKRWVVRGDSIAQEGMGQNVRLTFGDVNWRDYEYTVEARKTGGREGFLILFRVKSDEDFYWCNLGWKRNTSHRIERSNKGSEGMVRVGRSDGKIEQDKWYKIRVRCQGSNFRVWLDGKNIINVTDGSDAHLTGCVGIGTWATQAVFRNLKVKALDGSILYEGIPKDLVRRNTASD